VAGGCVDTPEAASPLVRRGRLELILVELNRNGEKGVRQDCIDGVVEHGHAVGERHASVLALASAEISHVEMVIPPAGASQDVSRPIPIKARVSRTPENIAADSKWLGAIRVFALVEESDEGFAHFLWAFIRTSSVFFGTVNKWSIILSNRTYSFDGSFAILPSWSARH
jgi:cell division septation protein DedD